MWNSDLLRETISEKIGDSLFVVVSNREPYIHVFKEGKINVMHPASGLVTGLEPVVRATGGIWVAHGSGTADKMVVDKRDCVRMPASNPSYTLKRVWLSKEEEDGYYYGFSNETLWPLCHVVYTKPTLERADWDFYTIVNEKFRDAVLDIIGEKKAFIWIQDYHFALLPRMLKERRPDLLIAHFWHIPWPNPEVFRICPWTHEILWGLLANDIIGFHIRYHCDNFLNTVDRELEVRVDRERSSVFHHGGIETKVRPFPISIDFEAISRDVESEKVIEGSKRLKDEFSIQDRKVILGLDRIDYTKGIPERLKAVNRFFEKYPEYREKVVFLQMGTLSRMHIKRYKDLNDEINALVEEINWKFSTETWSPVILVRRSLDYMKVLEYYRIADICVVSSLHDGMNLVAKEYVASKNDASGILVLSRFTGAARELEDSLLINPYDIESFADTLKEAIDMPFSESEARMKKMREKLALDNIYRWAVKMVSELAKLG